MRRSNVIFQCTPRYQSSFNTWLATWLCCLPQFKIDVQESVTLSHLNQGTRFKQFPRAQKNDVRLVETGDHLFFHHKKLAIHNMMMCALYILFVDPTNKPIAEKVNNGRNETEAEKRYITRFSEETPANWARAITNDINCFAIQEGVVKEEHLSLFEQGIKNHLPGWELRGGTQFGLYFLVRKEYAKHYVINEKLSSELKKLNLDSRCFTLRGPKESVSNIHVPHSDPETNYKKIAHAILDDMINQLNPTRSAAVTLEITHIVSKDGHMKDGGTRRVSVDGITELTLSQGSNVISHKILGDFNLELDQRQKLDQTVFSEVQEKFAYSWVCNTVCKKLKYIAGLIIGGGVTLSTDFAAVDEAGAAATVLGRGAAFFTENAAPCLENAAAVGRNLLGGTL